MRPVHPHSRGEHRIKSQLVPSYTGSSPLARGTLSENHACPQFARFIPTRAGNTSRLPITLRICSVHPHSRGEHFLGLQPRSRIDGSSPLARGTQERCERGQRQIRFIPTRAGNTSMIPIPSPGITVHPHSRGEHKILATCLGTILGSSPLARGTHRQSPHQRGRCRFIPTRAGNTLCSRPSSIEPAVHPHSRGEHTETQFIHGSTAGSSPLARGTHRVQYS